MNAPTATHRAAPDAEFASARPTLREHDLLRQVVDQSGEGVLMIDDMGRVLSANRAAGELFGCEAEDLSGEPLPALLPAQQAGRSSCELYAALRGARAWSGLAVARSARRTAFAVHVTLAFARNADGAPAAAIMYLRSPAATQRTLERFKRLSITDDLTGVYNVRYLWSRLRHEFLRARRYGRPLCCLMADLDRFKRVNDTYGHRTGDETLRHVARTLRESVREVDILARYGGEEFAVVLPDTTLDGAVLCAEHIRRAVGAREVPAGTQTLRVSVSIGAACADVGTPDEEALLRRADLALLRAKREGRDRVCVALSGNGLDAAADGPSERPDGPRPGPSSPERVS